MAKAHWHPLSQSSRRVYVTFTHDVIFRLALGNYPFALNDIMTQRRGFLGLFLLKYTINNIYISIHPLYMGIVHTTHAYICEG